MDGHSARRSRSKIIRHQRTNRTAMKYRKLRIAWSVVWGLAAVLLIALWVRSEHRFDAVGSVTSAQGKLYLYPKINLSPIGDQKVTIESDTHLHGAVTTIAAWGAQV